MSTPNHDPQYRIRNAGHAWLAVVFQRRPDRLPEINHGGRVWLPLSGTQARDGVYFADYRLAGSSSIMAMGRIY